MNKHYNKFRLLIAFVFISLLTGCIADVANISDSPKIYSINCTGWPMSMNTCYAAAERRCPNGYTILANSPAAVSAGTLLAKEFAPDRVQIRGFTISCK